MSSPTVLGMFSPATTADFSERRVRFLHRRAAGGIRDDVAKEWTKIIEEGDDEVEDGDDALDGAGDGVITRTKGSLLETAKDGIKYWKEWRRKGATATATAQSVAMEQEGVGRDLVDDATRQVHPRPQQQEGESDGWRER
jgi:hypothetical protein